MEIFAKLESWDYLAAAMLLFSAWLLLGGIGRLQKSLHRDVIAVSEDYRCQSVV